MATGLRFGAAQAVAAALALSGVGVAPPVNAAQADGHQPRPRKQPQRVSVTRKLFDQVFGGLAGDRFVTHTFTEKPLGKRARRRLRGRLKQEKRNG